MKFAHKLLALSLIAILRTGNLSADDERRLPTGARLDPAASTIEAGNFPLSIAIAPGSERVVLLLCGWREQGIQVVDRKEGRVVQTIRQPSAFVGLAFSPDGKTLWASGGNADAVFRYAWRDGEAVPDGSIALAVKEPHASGSRYPAGIGTSRDGKFLYVAENLSDTIAVVDIAKSTIIQRVRTGRYPYAIAMSDGELFVSCWGEQEVDRFRRSTTGLLGSRRRIRVARHPSAILLDEASHRVYVASASTDRISVVDVQKRTLVRTLSDPPPAGPQEGSTPNALALSPDRKLLFVAEADNNAVAIFNLSTGKLDGRVPVQWYPTALAIADERLLVVSAKGNGTVPNPRRIQPGQKPPARERDIHYTLGQLNGSLMSLPLTWNQAALQSMSHRVEKANGWTAPAPRSVYPPFKHVIYIIKENRTYDQVLGDLPQGDGDPALVYFPREVSPNHHALAERFGVFDRFFTNAEVSAQGHNWSTAAYATDYVEKTVLAEYSDRGRTYDYEGTNRGSIVDDDDDVAAPAGGYLWDLAVRKGITLRDYGEFVFQEDDVRRATRRNLHDRVNLDFAPFDLGITDQRRADVWLRDFQSFAASGEMPALQIIRLPNDHTAGASAGRPTPRAYMADNDLALGRIVDAVTHSQFWRDTVFFILEDDAQNGPDHVDSHRSVLLVLSPYNKAGLVHRFVNTTDVLTSIEQILGLDSLSQFDYYGRPLRSIFSDKPDLRPYDVLTPAVDLREMNPEKTPASEQSKRLDLRTPDAADEVLFNQILWRVIKGDGVPYPEIRRAPAGAPASQ